MGERSFRGRSGDFELKVCFAKQGPLTFEIMQPVGGESLMKEFLEQVSGFERSGVDLSGWRLRWRLRLRLRLKLGLGLGGSVFVCGIYVPVLVDQMQCFSC